MVHLLEGIKIDGQQFTVNGITYPPNWIACSSTEEHDAIGIIGLNEVYPSLSTGQKYNGNYTDNFQAGTRTYTVVSMSTAEVNGANYTTMQTNLAAGTGIPDGFIASASVWNAKQPAGSYLTSISGQDYTTLANKPTLATVANTGVYSDLTGKPTIPAAQINSDWNASSGLAQITNKPTLATVATTGSYTDLTNKPSIGTVTLVSSADANATIATGTSTPVITIVSAPKLQTARTIGGVSFDGTASITVSTATGGFTISGGDLAIGTNNITITGSLGTTGARLTKGWFTDLQVTNSISGNITGSSTTCSGLAATATILANTRSIYGNNFDGSAALAQIISSVFGGTGNGFTKFSGPTTTEKTKTLRDATDTILELGGSYTPTGTWTSLTLVTPALGTPASGNLANCTFPTLNQNTTGSSASCTGNAATVTTIPNLTGNVTSVGNTTTIANGVVTNNMLAGSIAYSKLVLTGAILNADLAGSIAYSKLSLTGTILNADLAGSIAYSKLSLSGAILNTDLAGSIDLTTKVTNVLPFANGGTSGVATTSATTGTMTVNMTTSVITITPTGACTFNAANGGIAGQIVTFVVTTSGTSSFVLTFGTNFKSTATLATGTTTAKMFAVTFRCYATNLWIEISRTIAM